MKIRAALFAGSVVLAAALAACGGGGGSSTGTITPVGPATPTPSGGPSSTPVPSTTPQPSATPPPSPAPVVNSTAAPILLNEDPNTVVGVTSQFGTITGAPGTATIDGLSCYSTGNVLTHYHAHFSLYVNGVQYAVPAGTGIHNPYVQFPQYFVEPNASTGCVYPVHVHALMGMVHIENTIASFTATLGHFVDIWGQPMSTTGFGPFSGATRWFDTDETSGSAGAHPVRELTGTDPHTISLLDHHEYTVEVGPGYVSTPNVTFASTYP